MNLSAIAGILLLAQTAGAESSAEFARFAHAAAPLAIAALWQGAAIAAGLAICLRLAPRLSAAHRFGVWAGGFGVALGLQALPLFLHAAGAGGGAAMSDGTAMRPWLVLGERWTLAVAALWLALGLVRAIDLALHTVRLRKLWKNASPVQDAAGAAAGARKRILVCTTTELDRPSVLGFFAPRILIPDWLYARLTPGELEQVILHECEHLRRRDDWTNLLQKLALVLFPLNPALVWMERRLCREREMACDEGVVRVTRAPRAYAACLAGIAERRRERNLARRTAAALSLGAFERRSELAGRVQSILWRKNVLGPLGARALVSVVGCGLLAGAVELARSPQVVAFVSAPAAAAQAAPVPRGPLSPERLVRLDSDSAPAFRAMNAMAIMPAATGKQSRRIAMRSGPRKDAIRSANPASLASAEPPRGLIRAQSGNHETREAMPRAAIPQQWIVLTTWQQVETPVADSGPVADFDANAGPADQAQPDKSSARQIAVTQLILRIYPATSISSSSQKTGSGGNASRPNQGLNSVLHRRAFLPLSSGWLVIQL